MINHKNKILKVTGYPQNYKYVPWIRIAGQWLEKDFGFEIGDQVKIKCEIGFITITKINGDIPVENNNTMKKVSNE